MPHALTELKLTEVTRPAGKGSGPVHEIRADVCVVGAGIAGLSAAIESARLHRDVVLVDSLLKNLGINTLGIVWARTPVQLREHLPGARPRWRSSAPDGTVTLYNK